MENISENLKISRDKSFLQIDRVMELLGQSYWAQNRAIDVVQKSIENSICYGVYSNNIQVGYARVITDYATTFYICDVIIDQAYRGKGLGKKLIHTIVTDEQLESLMGILITKDAHGLYEQYGFKKNSESFMCKLKKG